MTFYALLAGVAGAFVALWIGRRLAHLKREREENIVAGEREAIRAAAEAEGAAVRRFAEVEAKKSALAERNRVEEELAGAAREIEQRRFEQERAAVEIERRSAALIRRGGEADEREGRLAGCECCAQDLLGDVQKLERQRREVLESVAGDSPAAIRDRLVSEWVDRARAAAAERMRRIEAGVTDPEHARTARRVMEIAIQRYQGHYLTERLLTNLPLAEGVLERVAGRGEEHLRAIEEVSNVKLVPDETGGWLRLEGQDSFGREIARRAVARLARTPSGTRDATLALTREIAGGLEREVVDLGRRAFSELEIPRAHPDIVKLVGKLQYRTSYTQNQWKHAVEAGFLCGMLADEIGLDVKVARRAALLHDVGKALTHEIDGSHAVIGAELARRLGETEMVANAIGAHHGDEPFDSALAFLVAGADALSGGRPGARRQQDEDYGERIEQLEHIASTFSGVDRVYAVHGGREVRVHVKEDRVSDARAVALSTEIARRISDEMTFPGQIKVTVIREVKAVGVAS